MVVQLEFEEKPDYLAVRFVGAGLTEEVWMQFELIAERCKRPNKNKLLLDFTGACLKPSLPDRYFLGKETQIFTHCNITKVAFVVRPEQAYQKSFGAMVAQNRGVNARVFTNVEDAEEWFLK
jgi:hypothetical protein